MINNRKDFYAFFEADSFEGAQRNLYKYTDCGAWVDLTNTGVALGSIVEGCDFGTAIYGLDFPFSPEALQEVINAIEAEADALWKWANENDCEGDAPDVNWEYRHLNQIGRSA